MFSFLFFALLSKSKVRSPGYVFKSPSLERVTHHASSNYVTKLSKYLEEKGAREVTYFRVLVFAWAEEATIEGWKG